MHPRRRAAEHQQLSDGGRKNVATAGAMLRGATRGAGANGMNTTEILIGGCWTSDAKNSYAKIWRPALDFGLLTRPILAKTVRFSASESASERVMNE